MLKMIVDRQLIVVALGIFTAFGILSKCVVNVTLKRMVHGAENMNKSNHPLMRLVRAKFEHACMVSEKVENVEVFVDKYLYEYRILGVRLHSVRRLEKAAALLCIVTGLLGSIITYSVYGMNDRVLQIGGIGVGLGILVYVFHLTTDENYRMQMARNYMVDYLQNVCLHRYEKAYQKDLEAKKAVQKQAAEIDEDEFEEEEFGEPVSLQPEREALLWGKQPGKEVPSRSTQPELWPPTMPEPYPTSDPLQNPIPDTIPPVRGVKMQAETTQTENLHPKDVQTMDAEKDMDKEIRIRRILEEFMA